MSPETPMRGRRRGFRRWFWISLILLPVIIFLSGNLWLSSPFGRGWIASKIQRATQLETRIGRAFVSPWSGIHIDHVELLQPTPLRSLLKPPLVRIDQVRLVPVWRSWFRGKRDLQSIELDSPRLVITTEMLADLARSRAAVSAPEIPAVATASPTASPPSPTPPATPPPASQPPTQPQTIPQKILTPTAWLHLKNASLVVITATSGRSHIELAGLSGSIPIGGIPAQSRLHLGSLRINDRLAASEISADLNWQFPMLSLQPLETRIDSYQLILAGKIALVNNLPLQIEAQIPKQKFHTLNLPNENAIAADSIAANARFIGLLFAPQTWQGDFLAESLAPSAHVAGHDAKFDRGSFVTILRNGMLSCVDARLIGDDLSLLGNGTLLADGRLAAALRLVAPPESATAIAGRLFPNLNRPVSLTPLSTPQRSAFDLQAFGSIQKIFLKLGNDALFTGLNLSPQKP